jgi:hypothetical protein
MMVRVDVPNDLSREIALEPKTNGGDLPAGIAELPSNTQFPDISIELDVVNLDGRMAIAHPDHPGISFGEVDALDVGQRVLNRFARLKIERSEAQAWLRLKPRAIAENRER